MSFSSKFYGIFLIPQILGRENILVPTKPNGYCKVPNKVLAYIKIRYIHALMEVLPIKYLVSGTRCHMYGRKIQIYGNW